VSPNLRHLFLPRLPRTERALRLLYASSLSPAGVPTVSVNHSGSLPSFAYVERADFGGYTTPVDARIALLEGPAWPALSLGCYWLFCANLYWFHALKYTQVVGTNNQATGRQTAKPKLRVAADGLPGGHDTPEGDTSNQASQKTPRCRVSNPACHLLGLLVHSGNEVLSR